MNFSITTAYTPFSPLENQLPIDELPSELQDRICHFLPLADLASVQRLSHSWKNSSHHAFTKKKIRHLFQLMGGPIAYKEELLDRYLMAAKTLNISHRPLIEALGGLLAVSCLPTLTLKRARGRNESLDFIEPQEMAAPIMRGTDTSQFFPRPFIALRHEDRSLPHPQLKVTVFVQQYMNAQTWVMCSRDTSFSISTYGLCLLAAPWVGTKAIDRLTRLIKQQPVGSVNTEGIEQAPTLENGQSVLQLK